MKVLKLENIFVKDPGWGCLYDEKKDSTYIYIKLLVLGLNFFPFTRMDNSSSDLRNFQGGI